MSTTTYSETLDEQELNERRIIIKNTKKMEYNFIEKNLDLNHNEMTFCKNKDGETVDSDGKPIKFISSINQSRVINRVLAETTRSVSESDKYDDSDNSITRAKRIYSRKKENLKILSTIFNNGGHMVIYFKYVTSNGNAPKSADVSSKKVLTFIQNLRDAYNKAEVIYQDDKRYLKLPEYFNKTMVKLGIFNSEDHLCHDFQHREHKAD